MLLLFFGHSVVSNSLRPPRTVACQASLKQAVVVIQSQSLVQLFATPWTATLQASLSFSISQSLLKFMSIESMMLSNHLILCHSLLLCLQSFPASGSFPMSWLLTLGGQSVRVSTSASVLPMNIQD